MKGMVSMLLLTTVLNSAVGSSVGFGYVLAVTVVGVYPGTSEGGSGGFFRSVPVWSESVYLRSEE